MEKCSVDWCDRKALAKGFCSAHYKRVKNGANLDAPFRERQTSPCSVCGEKAVSKGLCKRHYHRQLMGKPLDAPFKRTGKALCTVEGCSRPYYCQWMCYVHYHRSKKGQDLLAPINVKHPKQSSCDVDGCSNRHYGKGYCAKHLSLTKRYGFSKEQMRDLPAFCELCGSEENLHIDHDHTCCPTQNTCGKCVRGVLCQQCNHGLGNFKDDYDLLLKAAKWVQKRS